MPPVCYLIHMFENWNGWHNCPIPCNLRVLSLKTFSCGLIATFMLLTASSPKNQALWYERWWAGANICCKERRVERACYEHYPSKDCAGKIFEWKGICIFLGTGGAWCSFYWLEFICSLPVFSSVAPLAIWWTLKWSEFTFSFNLLFVPLLDSWSIEQRGNSIYRVSCWGFQQGYPWAMLENIQRQNGKGVFTYYRAISW